MMKKISHRVGYSYGRSRRAVVSFVSFSVLALMFLAASGRELLFTPSLAVAAASGQSDNGASLWKDVEEKSIPNPANRSVIPRKYRTLSLNTQGLEELLKGVPLERPD
jgi:hypothetical protein